MSRPSANWPFARAKISRRHLANRSVSISNQLKLINPRGVGHLCNSTLLIMHAAAVTLTQKLYFISSCTGMVPCTPERRQSASCIIYTLQQRTATADSTPIVYVGELPPQMGGMVNRWFQAEFFSSFFRAQLIRRFPKFVTQNIYKNSKISYFLGYARLSKLFMSFVL